MAIRGQQGYQRGAATPRQQVGTACESTDTSKDPLGPPQQAAPQQAESSTSTRQLPVSARSVSATTHEPLERPLRAAGVKR